jgi:hypothetical protein
MALVPMKQLITIDHAASTELDIWGKPLIPPQTTTYKCRVDEGSYLTVDSKQGSTGDRVVATAKVLLDKLVKIGYDDYVSYTNELGDTIKRKPLRIDVKRNFAGKPILTEVFL